MAYIGIKEMGNLLKQCYPIEIYASLMGNFKFSYASILKSKNKYMKLILIFYLTQCIQDYHYFNMEPYKKWLVKCFAFFVPSFWNLVFYIYSTS